MSYLLLDGVAGNFANSPHSVSVDITGDLAAAAYVALDAYPPAATTVLISKYQSKGWFLYMDTAGRLGFAWRQNDSTFLSEVSDSAVSSPGAGNPLWCGVTIDVDDGASNYAVKFYTGGSAAAPSWSQLGGTDSGAAATDIGSDATAEVEIGSRSGGGTGSLLGKVYRGFIVAAADLDGTKVFDVDFSDPTTWTYS